MSDSHYLLRELTKGKSKLIGPAGSFDVYNEDNPSCILACPAGVDIKAYVGLIGDKSYEDAVNVVREANPFPGICGRVCTHPCEEECGRNDDDGVE